MTTAMQDQKAAVDTGQWLLYRYNPELANQGENPLVLDSHAPKYPVEQYLYMENRFKMLTKSRPEEAKKLLKEAQNDVDTRWKLYEYLAARSVSGEALVAHVSKAAVIQDHVLLPSRPIKMPGNRTIQRGDGNLS
jgi:hypothetical protein